MSEIRPQVRKAGPPDVSDLRRIARAAYLRYVPRIGRVPAPMAADFQSHVTAGEAWIADMDGVPAGYIVMFPKADALFIENIAVHPKFSRRGIGHALMAAAGNTANVRELARISLYTNVRMWENLDFYGKLGFKVDHFVTESGFRRVYIMKELP